ncbi:MAG: lipid A deacylase LpxR family protein [Saprospiraceae bacterium]|nr:lipid A deacylase LpxR family protein [Saprospiraceae bacterium]
MNFRQRYVILCFFCFSVHPATAQHSDSISTAPVDYRAQMQQPLQFRGYMRLDIENDMLIARQKTDRYFTSGLKLDYFFIKNPPEKLWFSKIFPRLAKSDNFYGLTAATNMYTPANMSETVLLGDRPYAGWAYLGLTNISNDAQSGTRFYTEYSLGAIGPIVRQDLIQCKWHEIINRPIPQGWKNQIANDIALNLSFIGEKRVLKPAEYVDVIGLLETNVGTVTNYMGFGGMIRVGWFDDYFHDIMQLKGIKNRWQLYVYMRPIVRIVADNSLLQGGMFTYYKSPYTIPRDDINRYYMNSEFGYSISYRNINFTYSQYVRTPEYKGAKNMFWGATTFSVGF